MNFEEEYILQIIDDISWNKVAKKHDSDGNDCKITSYEIEEVCGFNKVKIRLILSKLKGMKLISNSPYFTGYNSGWFSTPKGHMSIDYLKKRRIDNK